MKILAIDFSSHQRSVAVLHRTNANTHHSVAEVIETGGKGTKAFAMIEEALRQSQIEREQIERLAIGIGPGSYTGIRGAIALAQGWQLAHTVNLLGISSVESIVAQAQSLGIRGKVGAVVDAQRNELYLALYQIDDVRWLEIQPLRLVSLAAARTALTGSDSVVGPAADKWFPNARVVLPHAAMLAQLALEQKNSISGEKLEPIYLREANFVKAPPGNLFSSITP